MTWTADRVFTFMIHSHDAGGGTWVLKWGSPGNPLGERGNLMNNDHDHRERIFICP